MPITDQQKRELRTLGTKAKHSIDNMERHVIEGDDPIIAGQKASRYVAMHLRNLVRKLEEVYKGRT